MRHRRGRTRLGRLLAIPAAATLLGGLAVFGSGLAQASPRAGSGGWQSYLQQPATSNVRAVSASVLSGSVTNARGLTSAGHGDTTLTVTAANDPATVLLDYGVEVEGTPYLDIASYNGTSPAVSLAFTEAKTYLRTPGSSTLVAAAACRTNSGYGPSTGRSGAVLGQVLHILGSSWPLNPLCDRLKYTGRPLPRWTITGGGQAVNFAKPG